MDALLGQLQRMGYRRIPRKALDLYRALSPPPRLVAHLVIVHVVAVRLMEAIAPDIGGVPWDADAIRFGAATHDLGKCRHREEITGKGYAHEAEGERLLLEAGIDEERARFARTHGFRRADRSRLVAEDLLVALADATWKGKREQDLEELLARHLAGVTDRSFWEVLQAIDEAALGSASESDAHLACQNSFAVDG